MKYFGAAAKKILVLQRGLRLRDHPGGLLLHRPAPFCRNLYPRGRDRPGDIFSLFRPGHQCPGHCLDGPGPWAGSWVWPGPSGRWVLLTIVGLPCISSIGKKKRPGKPRISIFRMRRQDPILRAGNRFTWLTLVGILIFAAWGKPAQPVGFWMAVWEVKWYITIGLLILLGWS